MRTHGFCPDNKNANDCSLKLGLCFVTVPRIDLKTLWTYFHLYVACVESSYRFDCGSSIHELGAVVESSHGPKAQCAVKW